MNKVVVINHNSMAVIECSDRKTANEVYSDYVVKEDTVFTLMYQDGVLSGKYVSPVHTRFVIDRSRTRVSRSHGLSNNEGDNQ